MYLNEFVNDKLAHSDTKDLQCVVDGVLEFLQRGGILTAHQVRHVAHADIALDARKSGLRGSLNRT